MDVYFVVENELALGFNNSFLLIETSGLGLQG
jgi:hypothetical protein